jgi:DNA topoisomerase-1
MLRKQVETDLRQKPGRNGRLEPLAVRLLDAGLFRVGNERYVRDNHTYGLTTLNRSQVRIDGKQTAVFDFIGKEHLHHVIAVDDRSATAHLKMLLSAPGLESDRLFQIQRAGGRNVLSSGAVNSYLHAHTGAPVTAKVFRTWGATVAAASVAAGSTFAVVGRAFSHNVLPYAAAAELLGDTVSVAKNSYVHPQAVLAGRSPEVQNAVGAAREKLRTDDVRAIFRSASVQTAVLTFLENNPLD